MEGKDPNPPYLCVTVCFNHDANACDILWEKKKKDLQRPVICNLYLWKSKYVMITIVYLTFNVFFKQKIIKSYLNQKGMSIELL